MEFINEYCLMALGYLMLYFAPIVTLRDTQTGMQLETGSSDEVWDKAVEFSAIGLISFMTLINMALMVKISAHKLIVYCKKRKYKKWFQ